MSIARFGILIAAWLIVTAAAHQPLAAHPHPWQLRDGDRVVLLGGSFIERMQSYGYLETLLTAGYPDGQLQFRNLGWSGDTVTGISRALFGSPEDGFQRLRRDVEAAEPTVLLVAYGANEAYQGQAGLESFVTGLSRLLDTLETTGARIVLLSPSRQQYLGPPLPDPRDYNQTLRTYCDALRQVAQQRGCHYVDLYDLVGNAAGSDDQPPAPQDQLTDNGVHLTQYGYWRVAPQLAQRLGLRPHRWEVDLEASGTVRAALGTSISDLQATAAAIRFSALDERLPAPARPSHSPAGAEQLAQRGVLRVRGLEPGNYELRIDDQVVAHADHQQWAAGVPLVHSPDQQQVEQLRQAISAKNELYFHRYRPQNETYLFLFRKHEQGNNAQEIPQFDPLVEEQEQQIEQLKKPRQRRYELRVAGGG